MENNDLIKSVEDWILIVEVFLIITIYNLGVHENMITKYNPGISKIYTLTANISKFSASENAPKSLENMSHHVSIFLSPENKGKYEICSKNFKSKNLEKSTGFLSIFWATMNVSLYNLSCQKMMRKLVLLLRFFDIRNFE